MAFQLRSQFEVYCSEYIHIMEVYKYTSPRHWCQINFLNIHVLLGDYQPVLHGAGLTLTLFIVRIIDAKVVATLCFRSIHCDVSISY